MVTGFRRERGWAAISFCSRCSGTWFHRRARLQELFYGFGEFAGPERRQFCVLGSCANNSAIFDACSSASLLGCKKARG